MKEIIHIDIEIITENSIKSRYLSIYLIKSKAKIFCKNIKLNLNLLPNHLNF